MKSTIWLTNIKKFTNEKKCNLWQNTKLKTADRIMYIFKTQPANIFIVGCCCTCFKKVVAALVLICDAMYTIYAEDQ